MRALATRPFARVDDEAQVLGDLVVQQPARSVGSMRLPVDAADAGLVRRRADTGDQLAGDAAAT